MEGQKNVSRKIAKSFFSSKLHFHIMVLVEWNHLGCNRTHHFTVVVVRTRTQNIGEKRCLSIGMWGFILKLFIIAL